MKHGKTDNNHAEIVRALRNVGAEVQSLADVGNGCPDLLVAYHGRWYVFEVKSSVAAVLTPAERLWFNRFERQAPVWIVTSPAQALEIIGAPTYKVGEVDNNAGK